MLMSLGHTVEDSHPALFDAEGTATQFLAMVACQMAAAAQQMEPVLGRKIGPDDFNAWTWALVERGLQTKATDYVDYSDWRNDTTRGAADWWAQGYDILALPTVASVAPALGALELHPGETYEQVGNRYFDHIPLTHIWNATGQPAISLPLHITPDGLPLGVSFVAAHGREDLLIRLASQLELASPWHHRRPQVSAGNC